VRRKIGEIVSPQTAVFAGPDLRCALTAKAAKRKNS
jgi:hypothetical protein